MYYTTLQCQKTYHFFHCFFHIEIFFHEIFKISILKFFPQNIQIFNIKNYFFKIFDFHHYQIKCPLLQWPITMLIRSLKGCQKCIVLHYNAKRLIIFSNDFSILKFSSTKYSKFQYWNFFHKIYQISLFKIIFKNIWFSPLSDDRMSKVNNENFIYIQTFIFLGHSSCNGQLYLSFILRNFNLRSRKYEF